ncbi:MAG: SOS response-associated peptidase [bacterium]|nr:SOS response-associated peptidase [bacterium]
MCGRFVQSQAAEKYAEFLGVHEIKIDPLTPSYNVAPTDQVYAVAEHEGDRLLGSFRWGLLPFWAKDRKIGARNINARIETAATKSSFKESLANRRCLIPADGFYEWQVKEKGKLPQYIYNRDGSPLVLAGLWSSWKDPETGERIKTCTILTSEPNDLVAPIHNRMPVALEKDLWAPWLNRELVDPAQAVQLITPYPSSLMTHHPVSTLVNKVANNTPELIDVLETPAADM